MCTKAAQTHVGVNRFQPRASVRVKPSFWGRSPNWQGVQAASEGSNMLPRKFSKCLQEWSNRATGGEAEEREISVRAVLGEAAISMAQARNNLQWQQWNFDCSTQSNRQKRSYFSYWLQWPGKGYFQLKLPTVKDYIKFQFTCTEHDPAMLAVLDPDLGLVSSTDSSLSALVRMANSLNSPSVNHTEEFPARKGIF